MISQHSIGFLQVLAGGGESITPLSRRLGEESHISEEGAGPESEVVIKQAIAKQWQMPSVLQK